MDSLFVQGTDLAGRTGGSVLHVLRGASFFLAGGDSLVEGQWVRERGSLRIDVVVPNLADFPAASFSVLVDSLVPEPPAEVLSDTLAVPGYRLRLDYDWTPGPHRVAVMRGGETWEAITLVVDGRARIVDGVIFPNPFRDHVAFLYQLTSGMRSGELSVYTLSGRRIWRERLSGDQLIEGDGRRLFWDGRDGAGDRVANGVYLSLLVFTGLDGKELVWEDKVVRMR
jgi:hypothetical protein